MHKYSRIVGKNIQKYLDNKDMTQGRLAELMGWHYSTVSLKVAGLRSITVDDLFLVADLLSVHPKKLLVA